KGEGRCDAAEGWIAETGCRKKRDTRIAKRRRKRAACEAESELKGVWQRDRKLKKFEKKGN
ncbi:hypothetical protein A2U01_0057464, partial [Trifolium medium]|nr:hypothetical protein [Trifolium medium]